MAPAPPPVPVLAVAADAVRELDGREALSALWTCACLPPSSSRPCVR